MDKSQYGRRDRLIQEQRHDPYQEKAKIPEPSACNECGVVFYKGRWSWERGTDEIHTIVCPACKRIADNYPAGQLDISGAFFKTHRDELLNLIHNTEKQEKSEHPMERIMTISDEEDHALVTTTGVHLARRLGETLKHAYQGELDFTYGDAEKSIRVTWCRQ